MTAQPGSGDPTVVVTGAAGAIGAAVVDAFLIRGFAVVGLDPAPPARAEDGAYRHLRTDVTDPAALAAAAATVGPELCHIVGVAGGALPEEVACAGIDDLDVELFRRSLDLNLVSQYAVVRAFLASLRSTSSADPADDVRSITVISSVNAILGMDMPAYSAAKGGLVAMVRILARLLGPEGILVNAVAPGTVPTPRTTRIWSHDSGHFERLRRQSATGRLATPANVAAAVCALAVDMGAVTGQTLVVDAGQTSIWRY